MDYLSYLKPGTVLDTMALAKDRLKPSLGDLAQQIFQGVQYYQQAKSQKKDEAIKERYAANAERQSKIAEDTLQLDRDSKKWYQDFSIAKDQRDQATEKLNAGLAIGNSIIGMAKEGMAPDAIIGNVVSAFGDNPLVREYVGSVQKNGMAGLQAITDSYKKQQQIADATLANLQEQTKDIESHWKILNPSIAALNNSNAGHLDALTGSVGKQSVPEGYVPPENLIDLATKVFSKHRPDGSPYFDSVGYQKYLKSVIPTYKGQEQALLSLALEEGETSPMPGQPFIPGPPSQVGPQQAGQQQAAAPPRIGPQGRGETPTRALTNTLGSYFGSNPDPFMDTSKYPRKKASQEIQDLYKLYVDDMGREKGTEAFFQKYHYLPES